MLATFTDRQFQIIEAAGRILTASGVSGLTIKNLAKEMQFSESAIYRHFESKEAIIIAMLEYLAANIDSRLETQVSALLTPEENFIALFQNQFSFFKNNPHFVVAVFSDCLLEERQQVNATILKVMGMKSKHLMPIIIAGQQKGVFNNAISGEAMLHIVIGAFRLQMFQWRVTNFEFDIEKTGNNLIQSILTIIQSK